MAVWLGLVLSLPVAGGQAGQPSGLEQSAGLPPAVAEVIRNFGGRLAFAAEHLGSGRSLRYRAEELVQTASVIKLPIMVEVFFQAQEGRLDLRRRLRYEESNRVPGAGILQDLTPGLELPLIDAVTLMIVLSDNTATNMVIDQVGIQAVNQRMQQLGLTRTRLNKKVYLPADETVPPESARFGLGVTTADDMLELLRRLYRRQLVDAEASATMLAILEKQRDQEQIPRLLTGPEWEGVKVAHKTGALDQVRNDVGLVSTPRGDFALSLFAWESPDRRWTVDNQASVTLARLARALLDHLAGEQAEP
ncbi:MAG: serine hydrolase [Acidobacteriota bacterium]